MPGSSVGWLRIAILGVVGLFLAALGYVATGVSRAPVPGVAYAWDVTSDPRTGPLAESPDSKAFAYVVWNTNEREAIGFNSWPFTPGAPLVVSRSFDLYVYDLVARGAPHRVLRWTDGDVERTSLLCWSPDGIVVRRGPEPFTPWLIDPRGGKARPMANWSERDLDRIYNDARRIDTRVIPDRRFHPELDVDQFFLWNPVAHRREWLFDLPLTYDGHPARSADQTKKYRVEHRYWASFHEVGDIRSWSDADSLYLSIFAFAREPGPTPRRYRLVVGIDVPDTSAWRRHEDRWLGVMLDSVVVGCPPDTVTLRRGYALRRLAALVRPIRDGEGGIEGGVWTTTVQAQLEALPLSGPAATAPHAPPQAIHQNSGNVAIPVGRVRPQPGG